MPHPFNGFFFTTNCLATPDRFIFIAHATSTQCNNYISAKIEVLILHSPFVRFTVRFMCVLRQSRVNNIGHCALSVINIYKRNYALKCSCRFYARTYLFMPFMCKCFFKLIARPLAGTKQKHKCIEGHPIRKHPYVGVDFSTK